MNYYVFDVFDIILFGYSIDFVTIALVNLLRNCGPSTSKSIRDNGLVYAELLKLDV